jgi:hypothetical protein
MNNRFIRTALPVLQNIYTFMTTKSSTMKKSLSLLIAIFVLFSVSVDGQGGLLKKVASSMKDELLGIKTNTDPEPSCACADAEQVVGLGGKLSLDYKEMNVSAMEDGSLLLKNRNSGVFYVVKDGAVSGPFQEGDSRIAGFENMDEGSGNQDDLLARYKKYISKSGDKFMISFGGKSYGPYAVISNFAVSQSREKFAALVVENIIATEDKAIENAKTEQEKMDLAMQYSQQMQQKMMDGGGPQSMMPKLVSNVPDANYDMTRNLGASLSGTIKYDDIVMFVVNKVVDLTGKTLITLRPEHFGGATHIFVSSGNDKYALYDYGTITFNNKSTKTDLFNPHLIKTGGQVYLAYMYYSPKKNALVQCKIPF